MKTLLRTFQMPSDCTGRVAYVRRTLKVSASTALGALFSLAYLPMANVLSFATAALFAFSVMVFCFEFCRGHWRAGSFCRHHMILSRYVEVDDSDIQIDELLKLRCVTCGRVELR